MLKKIVLILTILSIIFISINTINVYWYDWTEWSITSSWFEIKIRSLTPGWDSILGTAWSVIAPKDTMLNILLLIIENLMTAIWVIAILVMTIWWGYMIMNIWQDDMLTKWKSIFKSWLIALAVALWSWLLVKLVTFLLY